MSALPLKADLKGGMSSLLLSADSGHPRHI
jgi:hypothetical protein